MNNSILESIIEARKGQYCHCVEVSEVYELENIAEMIITEFPDRTEKEYLDFLGSLSVYSLNDENEQSIEDFSFSDYIKDTI